MNPEADRLVIAEALRRLYARGVLIRAQVVAVCDILDVPEGPALDDRPLLDSEDAAS